MFNPPGNTSCNHTRIQSFDDILGEYLCFKYSSKNIALCMLTCFSEYPWYLKEILKYHVTNTRNKNKLTLRFRL